MVFCLLLIIYLLDANRNEVKNLDVWPIFTQANKRKVPTQDRTHGTSCGVCDIKLLTIPLQQARPKASILRLK